MNAAKLPLALLGGTTISSVPVTAFPGARRLTADFPNPIPVVAATRYALVVTKGNAPELVADTNNVCPDGQVYIQIDLDVPFIPAPAIDLYFETVVTA